MFVQNDIRKTFIENSPVGRRQLTAAQSSSSSADDMEEELLSCAARAPAALAPPRVEPTKHISN